MLHFLFEGNDNDRKEKDMVHGRRTRLKRIGRGVSFFDGV